jgi:heme/copper-type cytochrome/quinol oxidase subunit 4
MDAPDRHPGPLPQEGLRHPRSLAALRGAKLLVGGYLALSVLTMAAIALLHSDTALVTDAVWIRGIIVVASALVMFLCALRMAGGSKPAYRRLRIMSAVMLAAIVVIVLLPGAFPVWMRAEQALCGLALIGVVLIVNGRRLRAVFTAAG